MIDLPEELKGTYQIILQGTDATEIHVRLTLSENSSYFHGHFPSMPVLPAVGIADISHYFVETYLASKAQNLKKISFFKMKTPIQPEQSLLIKIKNDGDNSFQVLWTNETENSSSAELNLKF